uniref:Cadherin domain-containing protein n=1 Tax=Amphilophus citrinellus TaxID=61819 RepID=A0A3Q0QVB1_AMPCI
QAVVAKDKSGDSLVRKRRNWVPPPIKLEENEDHTKKAFVARIHSDFDDGNGNLRYSLIGRGANQDPFHVFVVDPRTGIIRVTQKLDREFISAYNLSGVATYNDGTLAEQNIPIHFKVVDQNDNAPVFEDVIVGKVDELSPPGTLVMKLMATDADEPNNPNSQIAYTIIDQNPPDDMFYMNSDGIVGGGGVATGAAGGSGGTFKTYPIKVNVKNQPEGARFNPTVKAIPISEKGTSFNINHVIASYPAIDGDTGKPATNVRYIKGSDPGNWLSIDPNTAEIKLNKMPDRESPDLVNGTYIAKILCISEDMPGKTATGTIAIQVEDFNDHCPTLTSDIQTMCTTADAVIVTANDEDAFPNGPPFVFELLPEGTEGKWQVEHLNDTAAILRSQEPVWPGIYAVEFLVKDQQGHACQEPQKMRVQVCTCENGVTCAKRGATKGAELGPAGIGLLMLGLLLLLLIPLLLLFCQCGGPATFPDVFTKMPFDTKSHLINYHTEHQGENTVRIVPLLNLPTQLDGDTINIGMAQKPVAMAPLGSFDFPQSVTSINGMNGAAYQGGHRRDTWGMNQQDPSGFYSEIETRESLGGGGAYDGIALPDHFLRQYYSQMTNGNENLGVKDSLLVYDYEGLGSSAGSIGCCSLLESDSDLQFLNDLGPKFKTLAEVCGGKKISYDNKQVLSPPPKLEPDRPKVEQHMVRETTEHSEIVKESMTTVKDRMNTMKTGLANQGQMLLLQQQPVYYTTTPVLQPMHYVVQPQVQNTVLLAEAPTTNLQGMILVNNTQSGPAQGVFVQGQTLMSSGQSMMVVDGKVPAGSVKVQKGSQACLIDGGRLQPGGLSGSQRVLMVGEQVVQDAGGLSKKGEVSGSERILYKKSSQSISSKTGKVGSSTATVCTGPVYHKVQETFTEL